jgi:lysozyme
MQRLKISREGVILIKSFEGFRPRAIRLDDGRWVIGYGHTLSAREGATVSEADAELLLQYDLIPVAQALNEGVAATLNQHQFDALASFAFSVGVDRFQSSDVLSRLNAGHAGEAADAMIGWPEPVVAETALRRRAAERALFVADPAWPVALSDLLAAPLPPPAVVPEPVQEPVPEIVEEATAEPAVTTPSPDEAMVADMVADMELQGLTTSTPARTDEVAPSEPEIPSEYVAPDLDTAQSARHAAIASLLAGPDPVLRQTESASDGAEDSKEPAPAEAGALAEPEIQAPVAEEPALETPAVADTGVADATPDAAEPAPPSDSAREASVEAAPAPASSLFGGGQHNLRYSAYAAAIVGPLPGPALSSMTGALADDATTGSAQPVANPFAAAPVETAAVETPEGAPHPVSEAAETPEAPTASGVQAEPRPWYVDGAPAAEGVQADPFPASAFPAAPLADAPVAPPEIEAEPNPFAPTLPQPSPFDVAPPEPVVELPRFAAAPPLPAPEPWTAISATSEPRTDGELLVLTPPAVADVFASPRLVWPQGEQSGDETHPLFEDDGSLRLAPGNILRHEAFDEVPPARIPWGEMAAYGLMGGFGLVSFGMSMAAFRRASESSSGGDGVTLIAIVLAVIGAACVGVSAYNLYRRWGRADAE